MTFINSNAISNTKKKKIIIIDSCILLFCFVQIKRLEHKQNFEF